MTVSATEGVPLGTRVAVVSPNGKPIRGLRERRLAVPPAPGRMAVPVFEVPRGVPFSVVVDTRKARSKANVSISAIDSRTVLGAHDVLVRKGTRTRADFDLRRGTVIMATSRRSQPDLRVGLDRKKFDYRIDLLSLAQGGGDPIAARIKRGKGRVVLVPSLQRRTAGVLRITRTAAKHRTATHEVALVLRAGDRVRVDYAAWKPGKRLTVSVLRPGKGAVRVPTHR